MDFREQIKKLMKKKGIKTARLARLADLNYGTVYYFLKGDEKRGNMTTNNLNKLFEVLNKL